LKMVEPVDVLIEVEKNYIKREKVLAKLEEFDKLIEYYNNDPDGNFEFTLLYDAWKKFKEEIK